MKLYNYLSIHLSIGLFFYLSIYLASLLIFLNYLSNLSCPSCLSCLSCLSNLSNLSILSNPCLSNNISNLSNASNQTSLSSLSNLSHPSRQVDRQIDRQTGTHLHRYTSLRISFGKRIFKDIHYRTQSHFWCQEVASTSWAQKLKKLKGKALRFASQLIFHQDL